MAAKNKKSGAKKIPAKGRINITVNGRALVSWK